MGFIHIQNSNLAKGYYSLSGGAKIPSGADMNSDTYKIPGNYVCDSNNVASTLKNCPLSNAFVLKVDYGTSSNYPRQTYLRFDSKETCARTWDNYTNKWLDTVYNITNFDFTSAVKTTGVSAGKAVSLYVNKLNDTQNYVQFFVDGVDKGYITFDVSRNIK